MSVITCQTRCAGFSRSAVSCSCRGIRSRIRSASLTMPTTSSLSSSTGRDVMLWVASSAAASSTGVSVWTVVTGRVMISRIFTAASLMGLSNTDVRHAPTGVAEREVPSLGPKVPPVRVRRPLRDRGSVPCAEDGCRPLPTGPGRTPETPPPANSPKELTMAHRKVEQVMTTQVVTAGLDVPYKRLVELLAGHRISGPNSRRTRCTWPSAAAGSWVARRTPCARGT